ncbi:hypothetical protein IFM89_016951 [Coptis chinensis]|uniref:NAC domain-containing protein n=1 Tax=Coptis chinensis TaxID=261450 RepID=A0A835LIA2_9MAGN|nr:hypothetical protein IFM89_016951 [Coptis chinensis]
MRAPNGMKSGWVMHEFRLENLHMPPKEEWVLCRVFHKGKEDLSSKKCLEYDTDDAIIGFGLVGDNVGILGEGKRFARTEFLRHRKLGFDYKTRAVFLWLEGENDGNLGLPGHVFRQRLPEWTADVEYYSCKEYPRLNDALHYNIYNGVRQNALVEIFQILTMVCETHKLALAQTWVPCKHRGVLARRWWWCEEEVHADMWGLAALGRASLTEGRGWWRAFSSKSSCFSSDMTQLSKSEYPRVHHATHVWVK